MCSPSREVAECIKRLLLAGVAVFFTRGSLMQIAVSTILIFNYLILLVLLKPYKQHNTFAFVVNLSLFMTLFVGIFVKLLNGWSNKGLYEEGFSLDFLAGFLILCAITVIGAFIGKVSLGVAETVRMWNLEEKRLRKLCSISSRLVALPQNDPEEGPDFYALCTPIDILSTDHEKLAQLKTLRKENRSLLESFFRSLDGRGHIQYISKADNVKPGYCFIKLNCKTDESTLGKAVRPTLLEDFPRYGLEHIRDFLRFKVVVSCVIDAFLFMDLLLDQSGWKIVKFDIAKFVR